ncbi:MAG: type II toxin-antitoxin system RelE/ParE family toxin [Bacteroidales bacterium]|nr:type II toxin-antitoxin system RelE/ParE family toxin [Bacteroidales bacterium]
MAERFEVIFKKTAAEDILYIALYISADGYPDTAKEFAAKLYKFGDTLAIFPLKYPLCNHKRLSVRNYRCAVFSRNYMFIYKISKKKVVIYNIVHVKRLG